MGSHTNSVKYVMPKSHVIKHSLAGKLTGSFISEVLFPLTLCMGLSNPKSLEGMSSAISLDFSVAQNRMWFNSRSAEI